MFKRIVHAAILLLACSVFANAQVTTSSITGTIRSAKGDALTGATITATHTPTGTVYRVATRANGSFSIFNMNPGGPYTIVISFVGYNDEKKDDIFLTLGESSTINVAMAEKNSVLTEVVVAARRGTNSNGKGGSETSIGREKMANLPTVGRNLTDFLRFTPSIKITPLGGFSLAGQNNRYNSFMIDGAVNNDVFGLSDQGTNGGRAGAPPISIDAIDQVTVQLSPYDVSLGNFTGGGINAITRGGTNNLTGSVYYVYRNQNLAGRSAVPTLKPGTINTFERLSYPDFQNKTFGFRIGGPILKNKAFFFINLERQDDNRPQPFDPNLYAGANIKNDSLNTLLGYLKSKYNYETGEYINNPDLIKADRLASRFDWNINNNNQLTVSYRYTKLTRTNPPRSTINSINFFNSAEYFPSTTHSGSVELNSRFKGSDNNKIRVTYTDVVDDRGTFGAPFPNVAIRDNGTQNFINFGSEAASAANLLKQSILNIYDAFKIVRGDHTLTFGTDIDLNKTYNLFINRNYSVYEYTSIGDFIKDSRPVRLRRGYSLVDGGASGDNATKSAAQFNTSRIGLFVSDDIKVNDNFTITLGIRGDVTSFHDKPPVDEFWRDTAAAIVSQLYDLKGAETGKLYKPRWVISPRIGFKYNLPDENATIRGGMGVFAGRIPLVWPGGTFQNTGVTIGAFDVANPNLNFRPDINNQYTATDLGLARLTPQGELNLVSKNFKIPTVFRTSLAVDKRLGNGWSFTVEGMYTKNINEVDWQNLVWNPTTLRPTTGSGGDVRNVYDPNAVALNTTTRNGVKIPFRSYLPLSDIGRSPYTSIILITNSTGRRGYSYNLSLTVDKSFRNGFYFNFNYAYGNSVVKNEATSSVNSSNWNNMETVNGRNYNSLTISDFDLGHRITAYISKKFTYAKKALATTISLDYTGQSGSPYSFTMTGGITGDGVTFNDMMYIPTQSELQLMLTNAQFLTNTVNGVTYTAAQQVDQFEKYIQGDRYLRNNRGKFADRNGARLPFTNILNLKVQQDFVLRFAGKAVSLQVIYDVFNFSNMLNDKWGRQYFANFDQVQIVGFAGFKTGTATPTYRFLQPTTPNGKPYQVNDVATNIYGSSRWTSALTFRLNF